MRRGEKKTAPESGKKSPKEDHSAFSHIAKKIQSFGLPPHIMFKEPALAHRGAVLLIALLSLAIAAIIARSLGSEFVPRLSEGAIAVNVVRLAGTDLEESIRLNTQMEKAVLAQFPDEVAHVWSRIGTAEVATDPMGVEETDCFPKIDISSRPAKRGKMFHRIRHRITMATQALRLDPLVQNA